jgi:hypothetical protein
MDEGARRKEAPKPQQLEHERKRPKPLDDESDFIGHQCVHNEWQEHSRHWYLGTKHETIGNGRNGSPV